MERRLELATTKRAGHDDQELSLTREKTPRLGFWDKMVIALILGAIIGVAGSKAYYERRLEEAIKLQRFVHKSVMYEIREVKPIPNL
ncbi:MAG TPA: hypothetical protein VKF36_18860 [Syntrophorhabdales bacterium]|nr:hypothetical protein [Syntrophorhabdales bacterium]